MMASSKMTCESKVSAEASAWTIVILTVLPEPVGALTTTLRFECNTCGDKRMVFSVSVW